MLVGRKEEGENLGLRCGVIIISVRGLLPPPSSPGRHLWRDKSLAGPEEEELDDAHLEFLEERGKGNGLWVLRQET